MDTKTNTESPSYYDNLEKKSVIELITDINKEDQKVAKIVKGALPQIEKLILHVMNTNTGAIKLYESLGFAVEGSELKVIKQLDGTYADLVAMGLFLER